MSKEEEIESLLLDLSDDPEIKFDSKFDELIKILKSGSKGPVKKILKDEDLTKVINDSIKSGKYDALREYLKSITEECNKNFADIPPVMVNFSECSLGLTCERIPEELSQTKDNVCEEVLLDTPNRKIKVKKVNNKNFGIIIDTKHHCYEVKTHSIAGDIRNFSNWKLISSKSMTKESLDDLLK